MLVLKDLQIHVISVHGWCWTESRDQCYCRRGHAHSVLSSRCHYRFWRRVDKRRVPGAGDGREGVVRSHSAPYFAFPGVRPAATRRHCRRYACRVDLCRQLWNAGDDFVSGVIVAVRVSRRQREMYIGHARLSVCESVSLSLAACPHYCTDPGVTCGNGIGGALYSCALLAGFAISARVSLL